jgi:hypothetical protein
LPRGYAGPDQIVLSVIDNGTLRELARLDGRYFSTEVASGFTGRVLGIGGVQGAGRALSFAYEPAERDFAQN